ncbi:MAG: thioredoxin family protein [Bacteroidota bacterium]
MKSLSSFNLLILFFTAHVLVAQEGINFSEGSFYSILSTAKKENKNVFIDTYADWCMPCKRMEEKFKNKEVAQFYNKHFINYRVNMQHPIKAKELQKRYDIVFLPTMIIVDPEGVIKYQVDRELSEIELLKMGQTALNSYHISEATSIRRNSNIPTALKPPIQPLSDSIPRDTSTFISTTETPSQAKKREEFLETYETIEESSQKILAVLGDTELPPEVLRQEAYLRLEFMDGSHKQAAREYLATQHNWDTDINRKFILEFVNSSSSPEYEFLVANKSKFEYQFGDKAVRSTLEIITYKALYNAVPRPSLDEAVLLYKNLGIQEPKRQGYHYFISRLIADKKINEVLRLTDQYQLAVTDDHEFLYKVAHFLANRTNSTAEHLNKAAQLLEKSLELKPSSLIYIELLGSIYLRKGDTNRAEKTYTKAIQEAKKQGKEF